MFTAARKRFTSGRFTIFNEDSSTGIRVAMVSGKQNRTVRGNKLVKRMAYISNSNVHDSGKFICHFHSLNIYGKSKV